MQKQFRACLSGIGIAKKVSLTDLRLNNFKVRAELEKDSLHDRKLIIQKRLVSTELSFDQINLRQNLRRKVKPLPMNLCVRFFEQPDLLLKMAEYDQTMLTKLCRLCRQFSTSI